MAFSSNNSNLFESVGKYLLSFISKGSIKFQIRTLSFYNFDISENWEKVFTNEPSEICGRQHLKICLSRPYHFKFFKGCLPQTLLGPFLNTFSQLCFVRYCSRAKYFSYCSLKDIFFVRKAFAKQI